MSLSEKYEEQVKNIMATYVNSDDYIVDVNDNLIEFEYRHKKDHFPRFKKSFIDTITQEFRLAYDSHPCRQECQCPEMYPFRYCNIQDIVGVNIHDIKFRSEDYIHLTSNISMTKEQYMQFVEHLDRMPEEINIIGNSCLHIDLN